MAWSLTGLLIRAAESMGLHRDGPPSSTIAPFEAELRRRLWWHICFLDSKLSDCLVSEVSITESIFDTRVPMHLDDDDIRPQMTSSPTPRRRFTDLSLCLVQCDLWRLGRRIRSSMSRHNGLESEQRGQTLDEAISKAKTRFADDWLVHLDVDNPFHSFIETMVRIDLSLYDLAIHYNDAAAPSTPPQGHDLDNEVGFNVKSFATALACIEATLAQEATNSRWAWFVRSHIPWPALTSLVSQLRSLPWGPTCERAWVAARSVCGYSPPSALGEPFYKPLRSLMAAAQRHRGQEMQRLGTLPGASGREGAGWRVSTDRMGFDTAALEDVLALEMGASRGAGAEGAEGVVGRLMGLDGLGCLMNLDDGWDNIMGVGPGGGLLSKVAQNSTECGCENDLLVSDVGYQ